MTTEVMRYVNCLPGATARENATPHPNPPTLIEVLESGNDAAKDFELSDLPNPRGSYELIGLAPFLRDFSGRPGSWIGRFQRELSRFGVTVGQSDAPGKEAIAAASGFLELLWQRQDALAPSRIAPSVDGGVVISFFRDNVRANVEFFDSGEIAAAIAEMGGEACVWQVENNDEALGEAILSIASRVAPPGSAKQDVPARQAAG